MLFVTSFVSLLILTSCGEPEIEVVLPESGGTFGEEMHMQPTKGLLEGEIAVKSEEEYIMDAKSDAELYAQATTTKDATLCEQIRSFPIKEQCLNLTD